MLFGYTIVYVDDVAAVLDFYDRAFGIETRFVVDTGDYGELETGGTALAFASHGLGAANLSSGYVRADGTQPLGFELAFVTPDVASAFERAIQAGAVAIAEPQVKPWGQTVAYVRSIEGSVVELASPING
jgi:uncharacterized glyoxalase superfamily protein PhnB